MQKEFRGVADPDQAWILGELIRYLEHSRSGALEFDDMGESWAAVRDAVAAGTLRADRQGHRRRSSPASTPCCGSPACSLGRQLGTEVVPVLSRKELADPALRAQALTQQLCQHRAAVRRHPHPRHRRPARRHRRPARRQGHLPRRPRRAPRRPPDHPGELAGAAAQERPRHRPGRVLHRARPRLQRRRAAPHRPGEPRPSLVTDPTREIRTFRVALSTPLGTKRGRGRGAFIDSVLAAVDAFYARGPGATSRRGPPRRRRCVRPHHLRQRGESTTPSSLSSTDYSSQDGPSEVLLAPAPSASEPLVITNDCPDLSQDDPATTPA